MTNTEFTCFALSLKHTVHNENLSCPIASKNVKKLDSVHISRTLRSVQ